MHLSCGGLKENDFQREWNYLEVGVGVALLEKYVTVGVGFKFSYA